MANSVPTLVAYAKVDEFPTELCAEDKTCDIQGEEACYLIDEMLDWPEGEGGGEWYC
jgi:hypothetical protein